MSRLGLTVLFSSRVRRVLLVILTCAVIVILLLPRQSQSFLEGISHPVAELVAIPIQALASLDRGVRELWNHYIALQGVYEQNLGLHQEVQQLKTQISELREHAIVSKQLADLLDFREHAQMETIPARVIGRNATNWYRALIIDKGEHAGIEKDMGVVARAGVVGRVMKINPSTAVVLLLTDPNVAMAAMIQRSRDEGIVQGTAQGSVRVKYLPPLSRVEIGDIVVTSGLTGQYPRGLQIGHVRRLQKSDADLFQSAEVEPMVDFSKLEGVLVVTSSKQLPEPSLLPQTELPQ